MRPASYDFRCARGGAPFLAVRLHGRDPRTGEVRRLPVAGVTVEWSIEWPSGEEVRTQFTANRMLVIDRRTGFIVFPVSAERLAELDAAVTPVATRIRMVMADGTGVPFLTGTIAVEG